MRRAAVLLVVLIIFLGGPSLSLAGSVPAPAGSSVSPPVPDPPGTDAEGFLPHGEYAFADEALGRWLYVSPTLRVDIARHSGTYGRRAVVWYVADVRFREGEAFRAFMANPKNPRVLERPEKIARDNDVVYAQNGDLFADRVYDRKLPGVIIRGGKILHEETYSRARAAVPPLDELALFPDGRIEMRVPGEMGAQGYLDAGARDVLAFGPILFRDRVKDARLPVSFTHREPRSAIGVAGPGHFVGIMVEGRNDRSAGAPLDFVADRLLEAGCHEAFTLDGGQTAAMVFMGRNVMDPGIYNGYQKARKQQDIIGIGHSKMVPYP
ncbi:MAG TPA: phosphodiester glycosidase family protein [Candidatus Limnocylindria bacterium]|nr:phosphodiester glycosidase family protein [Candidatus Limnocylindria bacterium]